MADSVLPPLDSDISDPVGTVQIDIGSTVESVQTLSCLDMEAAVEFLE